MAITPRSIDAGVGIGEIFVDKYRVDAFLGHGGMGVVALCTHLALNERVAIKMLRRDVLDDADAVERFMREAQAAVKLKSEFVARVTDVGRSRSNVPYMVMEYLEGHDLGDLLDERGSLGLPWAVELTLQACEALAEAHSLGIIHRDVKPTNLFVTWRPDGSALIKVLDFGISKALTGNAMQLTQTQSLLGTPAYMSPEQMRSARMVDARTDIWSLGTVLYELLEGRRPFEAESFSEMCVKVAVDPPDAMTNTPLALQQVVLRCLEKTPEQRYASMAELARDLVQFSQDPHQAQVLVDRMSRTLRRSQVFERYPSQIDQGGPSTTVVVSRSAERTAEPGLVEVAGSAPAIPLPLGDPPSGSGPLTPAPHATPPARRSGVPAAEPEPPPAELEPRAAEDRSRPNRELRGNLSETLSVPRPRRRRTLVIVAAAAAAAALGVAISLARSPRSSEVHPAPASAVPPRSVAKPITPEPAPAPAIELGAAGPAAAEPAAAEPTSAATAAPKIEPRGDARTRVRPGARTDPRPAGAGSAAGSAKSIYIYRDIYRDKPLEPGKTCSDEGPFANPRGLPTCPPK